MPLLWNPPRTPATKYEADAPYHKGADSRAIGCRPLCSRNDGRSVHEPRPGYVTRRALCAAATCVAGHTAAKPTRIVRTTSEQKRCAENLRADRPRVSTPPCGGGTHLRSSAAERLAAVLPGRSGTGRGADSFCFRISVLTPRPRAQARSVPAACWLAERFTRSDGGLGRRQAGPGPLVTGPAFGRHSHGVDAAQSVVAAPLLPGPSHCDIPARGGGSRRQC